MAGGHTETGGCRKLEDQVGARSNGPCMLVEVSPGHLRSQQESVLISDVRSSLCSISERLQGRELYGSDKFGVCVHAAVGLSSLGVCEETEVGS